MTPVLLVAPGPTRDPPERQVPEEDVPPGGGSRGLLGKQERDWDLGDVFIQGPESGSHRRGPSGSRGQATVTHSRDDTGVDEVSEGVVHD